MILYFLLVYLQLTELFLSALEKADVASQNKVTSTARTVNHLIVAIYKNYCT
jgi:hypothetical protein